MINFAKIEKEINLIESLYQDLSGIEFQNKFLHSHNATHLSLSCNPKITPKQFIMLFRVSGRKFPNDITSMTVTCEALRWIPLVQPSICCSSQAHLFNAYLHMQINASNEQANERRIRERNIFLPFSVLFLDIYRAFKVW